MSAPAVREWLARHEQDEPAELPVLLCVLAGRDVPVDEGERNAVLRRAELLLATGGDPRRSPALDGRAVHLVAEELDMPARRHALEHGLAALEPAAEGLPHMEEALRLLRADGELAWRTYACAVLLERLADDD